MPRLAYLFSSFPSLTETFTRHQVLETERLGLPILLAANTPPRPGGYHPADEAERARTFYLKPARPWVYLRDNAAVFFRDPARYLRALGLALRLRDGQPWQRLRNLAQVAGAAVLARHLEKNEVVHVHVHFAFGAASLAIFLEALAGIPYSLSIHGTDALRPTPLAEAKIGRARFVATNCRYHVKVLRSRYIGLYGQRFFLVRGGLDLAAGPWAEHRPAETGPPLRLLHVGRLSPEKAQPVLLRALARLKEEGVEFLCRIAGDGPERPRLEGLIQELGLAGRVELLGALPQERVSPLYDWCQALLMPSLSEGTPMTIVEAMAKARAVVATDITGVPEMVEDGLTALLVRPNSVADLAAKLARLAAEPDLAGRLGRAGRVRAERLFDLSANSRRFLAVLAQEVPALGLPRGEGLEDE